MSSVIGELPNRIGFVKPPVMPLVDEALALEGLECPLDGLFRPPGEVDQVSDSPEVKPPVSVSFLMPHKELT